MQRDRGTHEHTEYEEQHQSPKRRRSSFTQPHVPNSHNIFPSTEDKRRIFMQLFFILWNYMKDVERALKCIIKVVYMTYIVYSTASTILFADLQSLFYENEQREHSAKFLLGSIHMGLEQHENEIIEFTFLVKRLNNIVILLYFINSVAMYIKLNQKEWKR